MPTPSTSVILGIETSCDETAAAVVSADGTVHANVVKSQDDLHGRFGGVVPELAGRRHIEIIDHIVRDALNTAGIDRHELSAIAVTGGPGLIGALLVGLNYAKALAFGLGIPVVPVNHLEGHLSAVQLCPEPVSPPFVALLVSGGHTSLYHVRSWECIELLSQTLDDAAGEAFDKAAKLLGLGYPGGPVIDRMAKSGHSERVRFPRPYPTCDDLNFSFSGIKTSLLYYLRDQKKAGRDYDVNDVAAGFQTAIVDVLVDKTHAAVRSVGVHDVVVAGGVAANSELRAKFVARAHHAGWRVHIPPFTYCTDNAAMIAIAGLRLFRSGRTAGLDCEPRANWVLGEPLSP